MSHSISHKEPKQYSIIPLLLIAVIVFGYYSYSNYEPMADSTSNNIEKLKGDAVSYFNSENEPTTQVANWVNDSTFSVAVIDNGNDRSGYAQTVCYTLNEMGLKGTVKTVMVSDIKTLSTNYTRLGYASC